MRYKPSDREQIHISDMIYFILNSLHLKTGYDFKKLKVTILHFRGMCLKTEEIRKRYGSLISEFHLKQN